MNRSSIANLPSRFIVESDNYEYIRDIGGGFYGTVTLVKDKKTGKIYAKKNIIFAEDDTLGAPLYFFREFLSLRFFRVAGLPFLMVEGFNFPSGDNDAFIITKYIDGGSLEDLIDENFESSNDVITDKMKILFGIAFGISILHEHDIVHRDLKPANVLLDKETKEPFIADFGFARQISEGDAKITGGIGTPQYMAPELLCGDEAIPDKSIDVYSFAVMSLEIITGSLKVRGKDASLLFYNSSKNANDSTRFDIPKNFHKGFRKMITECWSNNPSKRWKMDEIVDSLKNDLILPGCNREVYFEYVNRLTNIKNEVMNSEESEEEDQTEDFLF